MSDSTTHDYWTGLPISPSNTLYKNPYTDHINFENNVQKLYVELQSIATNSEDSDEIWRNAINKYKQNIGWNGVFDAILTLFNSDAKVSKSRLHWFGSMVYEDAKIPQHAIEITSRDILHKAPLHEVVWSYIVNYNYEDVQELFDFVEQKLCYFRTVPELGSIWISCKFNDKIIISFFLTFYIEI